MSEETKTCEEKEGKCCCLCKFIKCESCRKFLIVALGTFVGGFCALSLFAALHKPPMMGQFGHQFRQGGPMMERGMGHKHHFDKGMKHRPHFEKGARHHRPDFQKEFDMEKQTPIDTRPEIEE